MSITAPAPRKALGKIKDSTAFYSHQVSGIRHLAKLNSWLLADDMGLGKTLQSLAVAAIDFEMGYAHRVLVVTLASCKWNWLEDIEKHTQFTAEVLDGTPAKRALQLTDFHTSGTDILIVNYEQVAAHLADLNALGFDIVILDEAHAIKSHTSKRTKAVQSLKSGRFFLLTGSPLLNRPDELWSLLHRIAPAAFPKYWAFVSRYVVYGGWKDKQVVGVKNQAELIERLHTHMLRRRKSEVLDLPEKQHIKILCDLHPEQKRLYKQARDELKIELPDEPTPMELENALTKFLRLKQICGTTACIPGMDDFSMKLDMAEDKLEEKISNGESVVTFTQFRGVLAAWVARIEKKGIKVFQLHGDVTMSKRQAVINEWAAMTKAGHACVLACMTQVAGVGLNLTAASTAFMLDKLFVPKLNEQAEDRLHRIGTDKTKPVQIVEFICKGTVEERVEIILRKKRVLFDTLVDTSDFKRALYAELRDEVA